MPRLNPESRRAVRDASLASTGWLSLRGARPLCLPRVGKGLRAPLDYSLHFFTQPGWRRWVYRVCLMPGLCRLLVARQDGDVFDRLFGDDWPGWRQLPRQQPLYLAARYGSPGPYQKLSALFVDSAGQGVAFVKVALSPQASDMVLREQAWLDRLAGIPALQGNVPAVRQAGLAGNGQAYLMTTIAPDLGPGGAFDEAHVHFLTALGQHSAQVSGFGDSMEAGFIAAALPRLSGVLGDELHGCMTGAWDDATGALRDWSGPLVLAHRDFVPWNMCRQNNRLFVFDWEYAAERANPLHDFFHFHLMPVAASRWRRVRADGLRSLVSEGVAFARRLHPDAAWSEAAVSAWLLVYLLDVVLFYTDSRKAFNPRRPVLAAYTDMIRNRDAWRAA